MKNVLQSMPIIALTILSINFSIGILWGLRKIFCKGKSNFLEICIKGLKACITMVTELGIVDIFFHCANNLIRVDSEEKWNKWKFIGFFASTLLLNQSLLYYIVTLYKGVDYRGLSSSDQEYLMEGIEKKIFKKSKLARILNPIFRLKISMIMIIIVIFQNSKFYSIGFLLTLQGVSMSFKGMLHFRFGRVYKNWIILVSVWMTEVLWTSFFLFCMYLEEFGEINFEEKKMIIMEKAKNSVYIEKIFFGVLLLCVFLELGNILLIFFQRIFQRKKNSIENIKLESKKKIKPIEKKVQQKNENFAIEKKFAKRQNGVSIRVAQKGSKEIPRGISLKRKKFVDRKSLKKREKFFNKMKLKVKNNGLNHKKQFISKRKKMEVETPKLNRNRRNSVWQKGFRKHSKSPIKNKVK